MVINWRLMLCWDGTGANYCWIIWNAGGSGVYTWWLMLHMNIACILYGIHLCPVCRNCIHYIIWMHFYAQIVRDGKIVWNKSTKLATLASVVFVFFLLYTVKCIYDDDGDRLTDRPTDHNNNKQKKSLVYASQNKYTRYIQNDKPQTLSFSLQKQSPKYQIEMVYIAFFKSQSFTFISNR